MRSSIFDNSSKHLNVEKEAVNKGGFHDKGTRSISPEMSPPYHHTLPYAYDTFRDRSKLFGDIRKRRKDARSNTRGGHFIKNDFG